MQTFERYRQIAFAEAISTLALFFLAMPLKYGLGMDMAVTLVGWAHGVLFIAYGGMLLLCWRRYAWPFSVVLLAGLAALVPGGPFLMDRRLPRPALAEA